MSKWTLEKIIKQVKRGDTFNYNTYKNELIVRVDDVAFTFFDTNYNGINRYDGTQNWHEFKFYRNGEEILPEPDRELIKFTEKLIDSVPRFVTEKNETIYMHNREIKISNTFEKKLCNRRNPKC